jgi:hypothetical protein
MQSRYLIDVCGDLMIDASPERKFFTSRSPPRDKSTAATRVTARAALC